MKRPIVSLYEYQKTGVETMVSSLLHGTYLTRYNEYTNTRGFLLFDEMGLGKTLQTCEAVKGIQAIPPILVIGPAACLHVWADSGFTMVSYDALVVAYKQFLKSYQSMDNDELRRLLCIYGKDESFLRRVQGDDLRRELLAFVEREVPFGIRGGKREALYTTKWSCIIMDEAHKFKNPKSIRAKAVGMLQGAYRICLTGTPVMNHGGDLYTILKYGLGLFDANWAELTHNPNGAYCTQLLAMVTLGRKKADLVELAEILPKRAKDDEVVLLDWIDPDQRARYVNAKNDAIIAAKRKNNHMNFLAKLQILRQICLHSDFDVSGDIRMPTHSTLWSPQTHEMFHPWIRQRVQIILESSPLPPYATHLIILHFVAMEQRLIQPSPKMMEVYRLYRPGVKMLVFCTFRTFLNTIMRPWLQQLGINSLIFSGGMTQKSRDQILERFRSDSTIDILLLVKAVGAEGLNLQDVCHHCIIMDPHFNTALDEQAAQRIDRLGQMNSEVIIRRLFMKGSIDEAMRIMQQQKVETIDSWVGAGTGKKTLEIHSLFLKKYDTV
jgi:SNF2 family DNA or RNA helicase